MQPPGTKVLKTWYQKLADGNQTIGAKRQECYQQAFTHRSQGLVTGELLAGRSCNSAQNSLLDPGDPYGPDRTPTSSSAPSSAPQTLAPAASDAQRAVPAPRPDARRGALSISTAICRPSFQTRTHTTLIYPFSIALITGLPNHRGPRGQGASFEQNCMICRLDLQLYSSTVYTRKPKSRSAHVQDPTKPTRQGNCGNAINGALKT
eukprot:COSAG02_NODE_2160_length_9627_cov_17.846558_1_plen_206_part_00